MRYVPILLAVFATSAFAGDYYVDAQNGSDTTGDGSAGNPWQTIQHAFDNVSAYDGDGVDTVYFDGATSYGTDGVAQDNDDGINIFGYDVWGGNLDVSLTEDANITILFAGSLQLILGESSTVSDCDDYYYSPQTYLSVTAENKDNIAVLGNDTMSNGVPMGITITGGSGHRISGNTAYTLGILVNGIASSTVSGNTTELVWPSYDTGGIRSVNSQVEIRGNCYMDITASGEPDIHGNTYGQMTITDVLPLEIYNNRFPDLGGILLHDIGVDFNLPEGTTCIFRDNYADIDVWGSDLWDRAPLFQINSGEIIVEGCSFHYNIDYIEPDNPDLIATNGGVADFGGGPLGSTGGNSFEGPDWDPDLPIYIVNNALDDNVYALYNTWDDETTAEMDGRYYDTTNVNKLYDKWEDLSKGFVIWSAPDPDGPVPAFELLSPADGEHVTDTPTLDWEDMPGCPWITFSHFDLYVDINPAFPNPDVYSNLTQSEYTFADPLDDGVTYYWKVKVFDTGSHDRWSEQTDWSFVVEGGSLGDFSLLSPPNGATVTTARPTLDWEDAQPAKWGRNAKNALSSLNGERTLVGNRLSNIAKTKGKAITLDHYDLYVDTDPEYGNPDIIGDIAESTYTFDYDLDDGETYYWKVKAVDSLDRELWCNELDWWFLVDIPEGIRSASLGEIKAAFKYGLPVNSGGSTGTIK
ncbi:MAG: hypothetical protein GY771_03150 [bacterium]|nr:hypothetical protein [bacterium]